MVRPAAPCAVLIAALIAPLPAQESGGIRWESDFAAARAAAAADGRPVLLYFTFDT